MIPDNTYFRLRAVTFDNVPWVVTMKKNDHYVGYLFSSVGYLLTAGQFPMSEYVKDPSQPLGWRTVSHERDRHKDGITPDAANLNPDAMDEVYEEVSDVEPEVD